MEHAKSLAEAAPDRYAELKAAAEARAVRWQWATFAVHSYKPADFEISKMTKGRWLKAEPSPPTSGAHGYGFDADGRVVVERQQTEFPGRFYETFFIHEAEGIASFHYSYDPEKPWINVEWLPVAAGLSRATPCMRAATRSRFSTNMMILDAWCDIVDTARTPRTATSMTLARSSTTVPGRSSGFTGVTRMAEGISTSSGLRKRPRCVHDLARSVRKADLPCRLAEHFAVVVVALDQGDFAAQVERQVTRTAARALRAAGFL